MNGSNNIAKEAFVLWAAFWSIMGPLSFAMWVSFAYGWV